MAEGEARTDKKQFQLVTFGIGEETFGIEILKVQEIIRMVEMTHVPNTPAFVEGVINLRGRIIPVIDLRLRLGFQAREHDTKTRIIVIEINQVTAGFVVDAVFEVLRIPADSIEPPPPVIAGLDAEYISGAGSVKNRLLMLLDLERLLSRKEKTALGDT